MTVQAAVGRKAYVTIGGTKVCGVQNLSRAHDNSPIDISSNCSDGFREILSDAGTQSLDLSFDGIIKDSLLRDIQNDTNASKLLTNVVFHHPNGDTISCDFYMASYEEGAPYNDAITFSTTFQSSGIPVYTAAP